MSNEFLNVILAITSIITTIVLIITLGIMAWQTSHTAKQTKLNSIISYYQYLQNMNVALLQDEEISKKVLGENKEDVMAFIVAMTISLTYQLHKTRFTSSSGWKTDRVAIAEMIKNERMRLYWEHYKHFYQPDFAQFIDSLLQEADREKPTISSASQSKQSVPGMNEI